jgi:hypothetical protein
MGKYGKLPESVNDVSTIHVEITSRNHLAGGHDRYSGDVGLGDWTGRGGPLSTPANGT